VKHQPQYGLALVSPYNVKSVRHIQPTQTDQSIRSDRSHTLGAACPPPARSGRQTDITLRQDRSTDGGFSEGHFLRFNRAFDIAVQV